MRFAARTSVVAILATCLAPGLWGCNSEGGPPDSGPQSTTGGTTGASTGGGSTTSGGSSGGSGGSTTGGMDAGTSAADQGLAQVSRSIALSADGTSLWVVNAESDSISELDVGTRALKRELLLTASRPSVDSATGRYDPAVLPRAIALVESQGKAYVAGQVANQVLAVDLGSGAVIASISVGAEPTAVVAQKDGSKLYVVNQQSATVQEIDTQTDLVLRTLPIGEHPWGASLRADGSLLYVSHLLLHPSVTVIDTATLTIQTVTALPDQAPDASQNKLLPNGVVRGAYSVVPQPNTGELWVPHLLLAIGTPQPALDFESTVFPTYTLLVPGGDRVDQRLLFRPSSILTAPGAFTDSASGPRDVAFTPDGKLALVALAQSEDVMVFDANLNVEVGLVRPTLSSLLEGIVVDAAGTHAYVQGRTSHNVTVLAIANGNGGADVTVDGAAIECLAADPMPPDLRHGQRLFYSANSSAFPITQNFWVACSTCHLEGQSDAVTWQFEQGPRDTPSNAGGPIHTGFLFRQAVRNDVIDYDQTIRVEQGGNYHRTDANQLPDLQSIANYTNYAIPYPQNPYRNPDGGLSPSATRGQALFGSACASCHSGTYLTDSGEGNPTLDMSGPIKLHDIQTCVTSGPFPDQTATDIDGNPRAACQFDTPTLRGIFATPPYFHDGSAATLDDVLMRLPASSSFSASDRADLVAYLNTL